MLTGAGVLAGLLVAASVALVGWPRRGARDVGLRDADPRRGQRRVCPGAGAPRTGAARTIRLRVPLPPGSPGRVHDRRSVRGEGGLAAALVEVSSMLRAGAAPAEAWTLVLGSPVPDRVPTVGQLAGVAGDGRATGRARGSTGPPLAAVIAAARVADELGAPLATVLDQVAAAVTAQADAAADVEAALAGPRSSARVLAWLPLLGVLLGTALGADPVGVLLGGGPGTAAGVLGLLLVLVGRWWSSALLRRAARAGGAA